MHCTCNFIGGLSDVIIKTFSQSVSQSLVFPWPQLGHQRPEHITSPNSQVRQKMTLVTFIPITSLPYTYAQLYTVDTVNRSRVRNRRDAVADLGRCGGVAVLCSNSLPNAIRRSSSLATFKRSRKIYSVLLLTLFLLLLDRAS